MGEDIEIRDVNGNLVKVPLYPTISACGRQVQGQVMVNCGDGTRVVIFRERIPTVVALFPVTCDCGADLHDLAACAAHECVRPLADETNE